MKWHLCLALIAAVAVGSSARADLHIDAVHPTILFVNGDSGLRQQVVLTLKSDPAAPDVKIKVRMPSGETVHDLKDVPAGRSRHEILVPDLREAVPVTIEAMLADRVVDRRVIDWKPARHWVIHAVHGSHHDLGYTDIPGNVLREHDENLDRVLDLCDQTDTWPEDSRFHYVVEQAWSVCHYVETQPEASLDRLKRRLREGRVEVTALFGNEVTELCGDEEQVRLVYPAFRIKRKLGIPITSAEHDDIPGVSWGLASVLAGSGVRYFSAGIPDYYAWGGPIHAWWDEKAVLSRNVPGAFWWEGPDGGRVLYWHTGGGIDGPLLWDYEQVKRDLPGRLESIAGQGYAFDLLRAKFHGSFRDNSPPNLRLSEVVREWNRQWVYPRLIVSTNQRFFEDFEKAAGDRLKVVRGDLPNTDYTIGSASSARETAVNRATHDLLPSAEFLATWSSLLGTRAYPGRSLTEAWDDVLLFDEHTWGMGHPVGPAQDACWAEKSLHAWRAAAIAQDAASRGAQSITENLRLAEEGQYVVVFNPLSQPRTDVARLQAATLTPASATPVGMVGFPPGFLNQPLNLLDMGSGKTVPHQVVRLHGPKDARPWAADRWALSRVSPRSVDVLNYDERQSQELVFLAADVPAMGYKTYRLVPGEPAHEVPSALRVDERGIENEFYSLRIDPETGTVTSLFDKRRHREWLDPRAGQGLNQVLVRAPESGKVTPAGRSRLRVGEKGPVVASLIFAGDALGCPDRTQEITLYAGLDRIDLATRLLKDATAALEYYVAFPLALSSPRFTFEAPNSVIRPILDQMPGSNTETYSVGRWIDAGAGDGSGGVTISSLDAPLFKLSHLWPGSVSQAHHGVTPLHYGQEFLRSPEGFDTGYLYSYVMVANFRTNFRPTQPGEILFRYSLTAHDGSLDRADTHRFGTAAVNPLVPFPVKGPREGSLASTGQLLTVAPSHVAVQAVKRAEDGQGIIVRLKEVAGKPALATIRFTGLKIAQARETNLAEEGQKPADHDPESVRVPLKPSAMATVRVELQAP